ncbi:hypothetical protein LGQ02_06680 [Bacillus shivajii]|uniref:hypothetical protein n=1 Tax=Bacillus shivajii TaxID=1983719 RepID=UPI001CFB9A5D|nr:hypothetical protein [Bacillus shivajii]UCZ54444.1 hypothetical protein LGQ02_06680 [Bacillus shivajii]
MRHFKFLLLFLFSVGSVFFVSNNFAQATELGSFTEEDFKEAQELGIYDESMTYEEFVELEEENQRHYEKLKSDEDEITIQSYFPRVGDVLTTSSSSSFGLTGHNGVVVAGGDILHFPGMGQSIETITWNEWINEYPETRVDRPSLSVGHDVNYWLTTNIMGTDPDYGTGGSLDSLDPNYCSKLVWQGFYNTGHAQWVSSGLILPYSLIDHITVPTSVVYNTM